MRLILAEGEGLNAVSCDRLLARLTEERAAGAAEVTIDLQRAAFVDPYGAACLALIVRHVHARGQRVICVLPSDRSTQQVVMDIGLAQALQVVAELRNSPGSQEGYARRTTLPLTLIRSRHDVQTVLAYLLDLSRGKLGFETGDVLDAGKVVSELCHNVVDHSGAEGLAVAHLSQDRQGRRYVALAVVDAGIGIRASLGRRHAEAAQWRHGEAIQQALGGLSSRPAGGGAGLRSVDAVVRRYKGRLVIRSGSDRLYLSPEHQLRTISGAVFPGTQVGISFSQRG